MISQPWSWHSFWNLLLFILYYMNSGTHLSTNWHFPLVTPLSGWAMISHCSAYLKSPFILRDEFRNTPPIYWRFAFTPPPLVTPLRCKSKSTLVVPWLVRHQGAYKLINYLSQKKHQSILYFIFSLQFQAKQHVESMCPKVRSFQLEKQGSSKSPSKLLKRDLLGRRPWKFVSMLLIDAEIK
jgi:hypothetical protein